MEEDRRLAELQAAEKRNADQREQERQQALLREQDRQREDRKSRDHLEEIAKEKEAKEKWALERLRLLREHEELEKRRQALTSKETLERLTRKPYYSRENLSTIGQPEVTTKVERQVIERVDRTLWTSDDRYPNTNATLTNYSHSALPPASYSQHDTHDDLLGPRERLFSNNNTSQDDRASKLKARNEKARRDYFSNDPAVDQLSDRFSRINEYPGQRRVDYRGPLLQQFNSGDLRSDFDYRPAAYSSELARPDTSDYDKEYRRLVEIAEQNLAKYRQQLSQPNLTTGLLETDLDYRPSTSTHPEEDIHRSKSVLDYTVTRHSRRDLVDTEYDPQHSRSKSADYLMNKQLREDAAPPENELKKTANGLSYVPPSEQAMILTEHEQRFRKSMERLQSTAPEWYRGAPPTNISQTTDHRSSGYGSRPYSRQQYDWSAPPPERHRNSSGSALHQTGDLGSPVGGISFPPGMWTFETSDINRKQVAGMFDKYKNEIEDMRRSRNSLHQTDLGSPVNECKVHKSGILKRRVFEARCSHLLWAQIACFLAIQLAPFRVNGIFLETVIPRVIEVADTFIGRTEPQGRVTIEEVLDAIFQETNPSSIPADPSVHSGSPQPPHNLDGPGIYTTNHALMDRVIQNPQMAEQLLRNEPLVVRCTNCNKTRNISEARVYYVSCKHCYTYYCSRSCRSQDWERHKDRCSFARINTLCKEVIMKVRRDPETQFHMSKVARDGYRHEGRGSVNIRLISAHSAQQYLNKGWAALLQSEDPNQLLFYYPVQVLVDQNKEPSLIQLCRKYNPKDKFILSVSIIADIEQCPETPPPEPDHRYAFINKPAKSALIQHDRYGALVPTNI
ncbi:hypothetical protein M3Y97_00241000 [Aphelenchoides bicaudatus]|nr:hypothetical protein M3Y97_00241000 [Aphelenchoides bicaudatus]